MSAFTSFTIPVALSCPISFPKSPVVTSSSEANSFFSSSSFSPVASSKAFITPVSAPVPETPPLRGVIAITFASSTPHVASVLAIIEEVTYVKLTVFTLIPLPDLVGCTYAHE